VCYIVLVMRAECVTVTVWLSAGRIMMYVTILPPPVWWLLTAWQGSDDRTVKGGVEGGAREEIKE